MSQISDVILREYPYPIAKCYEQLIGARDATEKWNRVRYLVEVTLKYIACIAVSRYLHNAEFDDKTSATLACLSRPTLGHWLNLFVRCSQHNIASGRTYFSSDMFLPFDDPDVFSSAQAAMLGKPGASNPGSDSRPGLVPFLEAFIAYRNRTVGHGAPTNEHIASVTPLLIEAVTALLLKLDVLKSMQLLYVSDIKLERNSAVHGLTRLMGSSPVAVSDYVTSISDALVGHDRNLFLTEAGSDEPAITMHPLLVYMQDKVYLLHRSNLRSNVDYICHHTGEFFTADRIYEDFLSTLGDFLGASTNLTGGLDPAEVYEETVRMSLIDGVISEEERTVLKEFRNRLDLSDGEAELIEERVRLSLSIDTKVETVGNHSEVSSPDTVEEPSLAVAPAAAGTRVLFLAYASVANSFWGEFVAQLAAAAYERDWVFSLVTPDPGHDHDVTAMAGLMADMDRIIEIHAPSIIILVPFPSPNFTLLFERRFRNFGIPILTIDTELDLSGIKPQEDVKIPPSVHIDDYQGGVLAADLILENCSSAGNASRFLVMPGFDDASHSQRRVSGFKDRVLEHQPESIVRVMQEGRFDRSRAKIIFSEFLEDVDIGRYQGIFCCNDDMALGVYQALAQFVAEQQDISPFPVVGFNNTAELRCVAAADRHGFLIGSVDQALDDYTQTVYSQIFTLLSGGVPPAHSLVSPRMWRLNGSFDDHQDKN